MNSGHLGQGAAATDNKCGSITLPMLPALPTLLNVGSTWKTCWPGCQDCEGFSPNLPCAPRLHMGWLVVGPSSPTTRAVPSPRTWGGRGERGSNLKRVVFSDLTHFTIQPQSCTTQIAAVILRVQDARSSPTSHNISPICSSKKLHLMNNKPSQAVPASLCPVDI